MRTTYATSSPPPFDKLSFVKYVKDIGREYRSQAVELISICRIFAEANNQTRNSYDEIRSVLSVVDDALYSATRARKKTTNNTNTKFRKAAAALSAYGMEKKYHLQETVTYMMAEAEAKDKSFSTISKRLKETSRPLEEGPTRTVVFLLHKSLSDGNPTCVKQVLCQNSNVKEIMWNFSRFKDERRLTHRHNHRFYEELPTSAEIYHGHFRSDPIDTFHHYRISILTNSPLLTQVFLKTAKGKRNIDNLWVPDRAIIFRDIEGRLEGEDIVGWVIESTPIIWYFETHPLPNVSRLSLLPPPAPTASPIISNTDLLDDWREPILRMLHSQRVNINIHLWDRLPINFSFGYSGAFLPSPPPPNSMSIISSVPSTQQSRPTLRIQIPGAPQAPESPTSNETAQSTPLTPRPPAVEMSPRPPSSLSPLSPETPTPTGSGTTTLWPCSATPVSKPGPAELHDPVPKTPHLPNLDAIWQRFVSVGFETGAAEWALTSPAVPDSSVLDTPILSLREPSLVDVIPSQSDTDSVHTSPTSTIASSTRQSRSTLRVQIPGAPQGSQSPSPYETVRSTPLTVRPPEVEMSPRSPPSLSPETPTPTGTAFTGPAVPDSFLDTATLSLREPSLVDVIPSQSDTVTISTSPTSTISSLQ